MNNRVPYTGATQDVNIGTRAMTMGSLKLYNGANFNSQFNATSISTFAFRPNGFSSSAWFMNNTNLTADRTYAMPNNSGTIPLTVNGVTADTTGNIVIPTGGFTPSGNSAQYIAGNGAYNNFQNDVRTTTLTGFTSANSAITATDTVLSAFGKAQGQIAVKANIASPTFTGVPSAPTAAAGTNTTQLATTQFVRSAITGLTSGTTQQYIRGNGTLSTFTADTLTTRLSGVSPANSGINDGITIMDAFNRLQGQILAYRGEAIKVDGMSPVAITDVWFGSLAQYQALTAISSTVEYNIEALDENHGNMTVNPSTTGIINIAHGLGFTPSYMNVNFSSYTSPELREYDLSVDATNITITFANTPSETSLKVWWEVKL